MVVSSVPLSACLVQEISMPIAYHYAMVCGGYESYVDKLITEVIYWSLLLDLENFLEFNKGVKVWIKRCHMRL